MDDGRMGIGLSNRGRSSPVFSLCLGIGSDRISGLNHCTGVFMRGLAMFIFSYGTRAAALYYFKYSI